MKQATISDILTDAELKAAVKIWNEDRRNFHRRVVDELIAPNMARINRRLGQENDARFLAYVIEHAFLSKGG